MKSADKIDWQKASYSEIFVDIFIMSSKIILEQMFCIFFYKEIERVFH